MSFTKLMKALTLCGQSAGKAPYSFASEILEKGFANKEEEEVLKFVAATLYGGGADTVWSIPRPDYIPPPADSFSRLSVHCRHFTWP